MKKLIAALMMLVLVFAMPLTSFASAPDDSDSWIYNAEFGYVVQNVTDTAYGSTRFYSTDNDSNQNLPLGMKAVIKSQNTDEYAKTKAILATLGMGENLIAALNAEQLARYAAAEEITTTVSYTKTDANGVTTNVTAEEALANADNVTELASEQPVQIVPCATDSSQDEYMKMTLTVSYEGGWKYRHSLDGEWLKMPNTRSTDSIGICVDEHTIIANSMCGTISYTRTNAVKGTSFSETEGLLPSAFYFPTYNDWNGGAAAFNMKNDWLLGDHFYNYTAHIEFQTEVTYPDQTLNFNVVGVYHHSEDKVGIDSISISMDSSGVFGISIGISDESDYTRRYVYTDTPYTYIP